MVFRDYEVESAGNPSDSSEVMKTRFGAAGSWYLVSTYGLKGAPSIE